MDEDGRVLLFGHPCRRWILFTYQERINPTEFGKRLRAFVVLDGGEPDDPEKMTDALKAHVRDNLARYKVPRDFVFLDELPRNATGKILSRELRDRAG